MKKLIIIGILALILIAGSVYVWSLYKADPTIAAQEFLDRISRQDFAQIELLFASPDQSLPEPVEAGFEKAFDAFGTNFNLTGIKFVELALLSKVGNTADFRFVLEYESSRFDPLRIESTLTLTRQNLFAGWGVIWSNNLPLPHYGLDVDYELVRLDPTRADIYDRKGVLLAGKGDLIRVGVQPDRITDPELLLQVFQDELGLDPDYVRGEYEKPGVQGHWFVPLIRLTEEQFLPVDSVLRPVPGVFFRREETRFYPEGIYAGQITGYLGEVTENMLQDWPEREYREGEIIGRSGLENSQDDVLRGRPGYRLFVHTDNERIFLTEKPMVPGKDLALTLDSQMQRLAYEVLGERQGAFVVLDGKSGAVLVLASSPSFDPNEFSRGISARRWQELSGDLQKPLFNRALQGLYPPGSVFKVVTAGAALDQGFLEPESLFQDRGEIRVEGNVIRNFENQVFGEHTLHTAIVESINTTLAQVGQTIGVSVLEDYFRLWGLDQSPSLGLPALKGQIGDPGRSQVALTWSAIGQDRVLLTPFHLAQIFSVFANEGKLAPAHLIQGYETEAVPVLAAETTEALNDMLRDVVRRGTGVRAEVSGLEVYGKTGTAEVVGGGVHAWFAGHVVIPDGSHLAFALLVEEGGVGGQTAAPLVREFLTGLIP